MEWAKNKKTLFLILLSGFLLRTWTLRENLFFGFEQGRDMLALSSTIGGDLNLIGPPTSIPGFFHGALSYWSFIPAFLIARGDPYLVTVILILINLASFLFLFDAVKSLFGRQAAYMAIIMLSFSYASVVYARWLLHPNLVPATASFLIFFLVKARKNPRFLPVVAASWGLLFHLEAMPAVGVLPAVAASLWILKIKLDFKNVLMSLVVMGLIFSSYLVFDLRNGFLLTKSVLSFVSGNGGLASMSASGVQITEQIFVEVERAIIPGMRGLSLAVFFLGMTAGFSLPWVFVLSMAFLFLSFGVKPLPHYLMLFHVFVYLGLGVAISRVRPKLFAYAIIALIVAANLASIKRRVPDNVGNFIHHAQRTYLGDELKLINYAYQEAAGDKFSYDYFSVPYWQREHWQYLFGWYGKGKYGYVPEENRTKTHYVFIEPDETQPKFQKDWYEGLSSGSNMLDSFSSRSLTVEKRIEK